MPVNVQLDEKLVTAVIKATGKRTAKSAVTFILKEYLKDKPAQIKTLFGTIEYEDGYDYKKQRSIK